MLNFSRRTFGLAALIVSCAILVMQSGRGADKVQEDSSSKVKVAATAQEADATGKQKIKIEITIDDGWYIYANPVGLDLLAPNATKVSILPKNAVRDVKITYPKAIEKSDPLGEYRIYQDKITIEAEVQRTTDAALSVTVEVNSCHAERGVCLQPGKITVPVK